MKVFSTCISYLFHPLIVPVLSVFIVLNLNIYPFVLYTEKIKYLLTGMIFLNTYCIPLVITFLMKKSGLIKSIYLSDKNERIFPLFFVSLMLYVTFLIATKWNSPPILNILLLFFSFSGILLLIINFFTKISLHLAGWGGLTGILLSFALRFNLNLVLPISVILLTTSLVAFARKELQEHTDNQIIAGFFLGILIFMTGLLIFFRV